MTGTPAAAVSMHRIDKRFGTVHANRAVSLDVAAGSIHGIVGENGAGKSTLMSVLYGFHQADSGQIHIEGRQARITTSSDAIALGIGMVHQHFMLVESFSALDNVLLGAEPGWRLGPARAQLRQRLEVLMRDTGLQVRLDAVVEDLPVGERQRLEILKALARGARILILDEPTAVLTPQETAQLFVTLRQLRVRGTTVLLITHKLKEIMAVCDAVTVMRAGAVVLDCAITDTDTDRLAQAMVGRRVQMGRPTVGAMPAGEADPGDAGSIERQMPGPTLAPMHAPMHAPKPAPAPTLMPSSLPTSTPTPAPDLGPGHIPTPLLEATGLHWRDADGVQRLDDVSLTLHAGEIVGVAGVSGNGQTELLDVLAGLLTPQQGTLRLGGRSHTPAAWLTPAVARTLGLAHVPEDRHRRGLVLPFAAWESAVLGHHTRPRYGGRAWMHQGAMRADTVQMMEAYDVRPRAPQLPCSSFSGGNQQKLVLAREVLHGATTSARVLLVGQPTRGVDIGAIEFIHGRLRALRDAGGAVLLVSSELDEILALADRVLVMAGGRITGSLPLAQCDESTLGRLMGGGTLVPAPTDAAAPAEPALPTAGTCATGAPNTTAVHRHPQRGASQ
jgi:ABC-type uncharacterized transport system ATPase subunit